MEEFLDSSVHSGIEPTLHFLQEVEVVCKPRVELREAGRVYSSGDAFKYIRALFRPFITHHEEVWIFLLNTAMEVVGVSQVSKGGITGCMVDVRIVFQTALLAHATGIILVHNHPAGRVVPSREDRALTGKVGEAGKIMEIKLLDHLIVAEGGYFSFSDEGLM